MASSIPASGTSLDVADLLAERGWTRVAVNPVHIKPGRNVIDLNLVAGVGDFEPYRWVRENLSPRGHLAHTWLWYDVDDETFNRFLYEARRRFPSPLDAELMVSELLGTWWGQRGGGRRAGDCAVVCGVSFGGAPDVI